MYVQINNDIDRQSFCESRNGFLRQLAIERNTYTYTVHVVICVETLTLAYI